MSGSRAVARLLLACTLAARSASAASSGNLTWGIPVYVQVQSARLSQISAVSSSFVYEAVVTYAWRDDKLWLSMNDGDAYTAAAAVNSNFTTTKGTFPNTRTFVPFVSTMDLSTVSATSYNKIAWTVEYGALDWTGAPNTVSWCAACYGLTATDDDPTSTDPIIPEPVWVVGVHSFSATFVQTQNLADFPFDTQTAAITITNSLMQAQAMRFVVAPTSVSSTATSLLKLPRDPDGFASTTWVTTVSGAGKDPSKLTLGFVLKRNPTFFVNRFVVPLSLLYTIMVLLLAVAPTARIMSPLTAFGSTVSFLFVTSQSVPQLPYATRLDKFFTMCFFFSFSLFLYNMAVFWRFERIKPAIEKSKTRLVALGAKQATWFEPKVVPAVKKIPKTWDERVAEEKKEELAKKSHRSAPCLSKSREGGRAGVS